MVIEDAGVDPACVNGLITHGVAESAMFAPATLCEYLGLPMDFGERVDLGGATSAGMVWRAAAAVELGVCDAVLAVVPGSASVPQSRRRPPPAPNWYGASSNNYGSPQAEFEIPYGNVGQNAPYAQIAQRYAAEFGYDPSAVAKVAVDQRTNACAHPGAVFHGTPLTVDDVLASPMIADPIHMLETVMRVHGGAGVLIANADIAQPKPPPPGVDRRLRRAHRVQDPDLCREPAVHADRPRRGARIRDGRAEPIRRRRRVDLRLLHDHGADEPGGRRLLRAKGKGCRGSPTTT